MIKKGFTLIELLVVIVIIGILVAIALPNFIKIKDKAREAEVKQNLHSIQLGVERYAVDAGTTYPYMLYGGDPAVNVGTVNIVYGYVNPYGLSGMPRPAFDMFWKTTNTWDYQDTNWNALINGTAQAAFGDTLQFEGYLPKYPRNPFQAGHQKELFSINMINAGNVWMAGCGGRSGELSFNTMPAGEQPRFILLTPATNTTNQFPGNFQYHPRWQDGISHFGHYRQQQMDNPPATAMVYSPPLIDSTDISSLEVAAYDLVSTGSMRTKGQDLDVPVPGVGTLHWNRTGLLVNVQERNPWITTNLAPYGTISNYDPRPYGDNIPDGYIIHLSSGMDKKVAVDTGQN